VWSYQNGEWYYWANPDYFPTEGAGGDNALTSIEPGYGYYIKMHVEDELLLNGEKMWRFGTNSQPPAVQVSPSWNLIGHYGTNVVSNANALTSLSSNYDALLGAEGNVISTLYPEFGYWLFVTGNSNLNYAPSATDYADPEEA